MNPQPPKPTESLDPDTLGIQNAQSPTVPRPTRRRLRVYAYDPSLGTDLTTVDINEATLEVLWEDHLAPGPIGEYVEVIDVDHASKCAYAPIDLNHPYLLAQDGLSPAEGNPQFHQQMVYAVAMKTIEHFEYALGRPALWARHLAPRQGIVYVRRLRIYPHALRAKNAFYSPDRKALMFGYFRANRNNSDGLPLGANVFTAVSHDIIAHETTHALLDGLRRWFREPTNKDVLAFHEAFADIVALFQHFTLPAALREQIRRTRGKLEEQNLLAQLAVQFGQASGRRGALRDALGQVMQVDGKEKWMPTQPQHTDYTNATAPHELGAVLVAAVFDAFLQIYKRRIGNIIRLATGGTSLLPEGDLLHDLVERLAHEAGKVAGQVLTMCIRALDYCPPVDLTFGDYLRAIVTADTDLVPNDKYGYRTAFVSAFRARGIYPSDVKYLSPGSLVWEPPPLLHNVRDVLYLLDIGSGVVDVDREAAFRYSEKNAQLLWHWLNDPQRDKEVRALGLLRKDKPGPDKIGEWSGELRPIEIHSVRRARRVGEDGRNLDYLVVEITQAFRPKNLPGVRCRGGSTLLIDLQRNELRYVISKRIGDVWRLKAQLDFAAAQDGDLRSNYFDSAASPADPFALLHMSS